MKAVDTNVLVRWITRDDPVQTPLADQVMRTPVYVPLTVLIELAWVLRGEPYNMTRDVLTESLRLLIDLDGVTVPLEDAVRWAIERHRNGADFADMVHLIESRRTDAFLTFERRLAKLAGPDAPVPVERVV